MLTTTALQLSDTFKQEGTVLVLTGHKRLNGREALRPSYRLLGGSEGHHGTESKAHSDAEMQPDPA